MPAGRSARSTRSKAQRRTHSRSNVQPTEAAEESSEEDNQDIPSSRPRTRQKGRRHSSSLLQGPSLTHGPPPKRQRNTYTSTSREPENGNNADGQAPRCEFTPPEDHSQLLDSERGEAHHSTPGWVGATKRNLEEQFTGPDGADITEDAGRQRSRPRTGLAESIPQVESNEEERVTIAISSESESGEDSDDSQEEPTREAPAYGPLPLHQNTGLQRRSYSMEDFTHQNRVVAHTAEDSHQKHPRDAPVNGKESDSQHAAPQQDAYSFKSDSADGSKDVRIAAKPGDEDYESESLFVSSESDEDIEPLIPGPSNQGEDLHPNPQLPRSSDQEEDSHHSGASWSISDYFRPPEGNLDDVPLVELSSIHLQHMLGYMSKGGWTESRQWKEDDLFQALSRKQTAPGSIRNYLKELVKYVEFLSRLCQDIPPAADHIAHTTRLQQQQTVQDFANGLHSIDIYANKVSSKLATRSYSIDNSDRRDAAKAAQKLYEITIPCLVLLLDHAFILGSMRSRRELEGLPETGCFSLTIVQVLLRVTKWIQNLYSAMQDELHRNEPNKIDAGSLQLHMQNRYLFHKPLVKFSESVKKAFTQLGGRQGEQQRERQLAIENDRLARQAREEQLQQTQEVRAKQMRLFYASMQKLPLSSQRQSQASAPSASSQVTTTSRQQPLQVQTAMTNQDYAQNNDGWTWDEDHKLLTKIRGDSRPDITELAEEFRRGFDIIQDRIDYLKVLARKKFRERGETPPAWWSSQ